MLYLLITTFYGVSFCVLAYAAANAPLGYEDEDGFHAENTKVCNRGGEEDLNNTTEANL